MPFSNDDFEFEILPQELNETESRQITLLFTLLKYPAGLNLTKIRHYMKDYYGNEDMDSDQKKLRRDMEALNELGFVAIFNQNEKKYQIQLHSGESKIRFSQEELKTISQSLIRQTEDKVFSPDIYSLSQKIFGSKWDLYPYFPESKSDVRPKDYEETILETILHSIKSKTIIQIKYERNYGKSEEKSLDPIQVIRKNSTDLYLYAYDRDKLDYRTYLIPCIKSCIRIDREHKKLHKNLSEIPNTHALMFPITDPVEIEITLQPDRKSTLLSYLKGCPFREINDNQVILSSTNPSAIFPILFKLQNYIYSINPSGVRDEYYKFLNVLDELHSPSQ